MPTPHEWLKAIGATESLREIANRSGVSHATLSRQITGGRFLIDTSIELARAYGVSPVSALVANGHITPKEAGMGGGEVEELGDGGHVDDHDDDLRRRRTLRNVDDDLDGEPAFDAR